MFKVFITVLYLCFLVALPVYSENLPVTELKIWEQNLGIEPSSSALVPRIEAIENILFGYTLKDNIPNRINNIKKYVGQTNNEKPVFNFPYNYSVGDYYNESCNMKMIKWTKLPVTVHFDNVPNKYRETVLNAINKWKSFFPLDVSNNQDSDINIIWVNKIPKKNLTESSLGQANSSINNNVHKSKILILNKKSYPPSQLEEVILHEIGHSIGLGHSPNSQDIMYPKTSSKKGKINQWTIMFIGYIPLILPSGYQQAIPGKTIITQRDINTLSRVYSNSADTGIYPVNYVSSAANNSNQQPMNFPAPIPQKETQNNFYLQQDTVNYINTAKEYFDKGNYNLAIEYNKKALSINPNQSVAIGNLGACYLSLNQSNSAIIYLKKALDINPNDSNVYNSLGAAYLNIGKYDLAIANCKKALEINPNSSNAYNNLGLVYWTKGLNKQAVECFSKSLSLDPNNMSARKNLDNLKRK